MLAVVAMFALCLPLSAQKKNEIMLPVHTGKHRQEIILPQVKGYNIYKADLHTHTIYSDGSVTAPWRVREAWYDGLDIIAITDSMDSPIIPFATHSLIARSDMSYFADSLVAPLSIINAIIMALAIKNEQAVRDTFDKLENIWDEYEVYDK